MMLFFILFLLAISIVSSIVNFFSYLTDTDNEKNVPSMVFAFVVGIVAGYLIFF